MTTEEALALLYALAEHLRQLGQEKKRKRKKA
jgi:hypothetical protein